jgi:hypothetical protein
VPLAFDHHEIMGGSILMSLPVVVFILTLFS